LKALNSSTVVSAFAAAVVHGAIVAALLRLPPHRATAMPQPEPAELLVDVQVVVPPATEALPAIKSGAQEKVLVGTNGGGEGGLRSTGAVAPQPEAEADSRPGGKPTSEEHGWFSPFAGPSSEGHPIDLRAHHTDIPPSALDATPSARTPGAPTPNAQAASVLRAGVDAHEVERGTAAGGEAVSAVAAIGHLPGAPGLGHATFAIRVAGAGISVALADGGADGPAWQALLPALRAALLAHPPRIPTGKRGLSLIIATRIDDQCPDGRPPHGDGSCPSGGGISRSGIGIGGTLSPENVGRRPNRMVHTRIVSSVAD
jgi:hypothetical protein